MIKPCAQIESAISLGLEGAMIYVDATFLSQQKTIFCNKLT